MKIPKLGGRAGKAGGQARPGRTRLVWSQLVRKPFPEPRGPAQPVVDAFAPDPRYSYQPETIGRLLKYGMMVAQVLLVACVPLEHTTQVLQLKHSSTQKRLRRTQKRQLLFGTLNTWTEIDAVTHTRAQ